MFESLGRVFEMTEFLTAYSIKEVSEMIDVAVGTLRQWESDFKGVIEIPRDSKGARYYTQFEIETLKHIKAMREKKLSKDVIRDLLEKKNEAGGIETALAPQPTPQQMSQSEAVQTLQEIKSMMSGFEEFKSELKKELRSEIRNEVKQEVLEEVRREIASSSEGHQKLLQSGAESTSEQIEGVSKTLAEMEKRYENEVKRRDQMVMENMKLMQEIKENQNKGFFKKLLGK